MCARMQLGREAERVSGGDCSAGQVDNMLTAKGIVFALGLFLSAFPTWVAASVEARIVAGPSVGLAAYDSNGRSGENDDSARLGLFGGAALLFPVSESFAFETGAVVGSRGGKTSFDSPFVLGDDFVWQLDYVSFPALLRWHSSNVYLKAGPVLDVLLSADIEPNPLRTDWQTKQYDCAVVGAIGFDARLGSLPAFAEVEGAWGLVDVNDRDFSTGDIQIHNRTVRIGFGVVLER